MKGWEKGSRREGSDQDVKRTNKERREREKRNLKPPNWVSPFVLLEIKLKSSGLAASTITY